MKITQEMHAQLDTKNRNAQASTEMRQSFQHVVQSQTEKLQQQELQRLLTAISNQGERLARFRSFRDLAKFKRLIKKFLQEATESGLALDHSHSFYAAAPSRSLTIVKKIDEKLIELTEEIMGQEKNTVHLLGLIGEIKGLLVNLYT